MHPPIDYKPGTVVRFEHSYESKRAYVILAVIGDRVKIAYRPSFARHIPPGKLGDKGSTIFWTTKTLFEKRMGVRR